MTDPEAAAELEPGAGVEGFDEEGVEDLEAAGFDPPIERETVAGLASDFEAGGAETVFPPIERETVGAFAGAGAFESGRVRVKGVDEAAGACRTGGT